MRQERFPTHAAPDRDAQPALLDRSVRRRHLDLACSRPPGCSPNRTPSHTSTCWPARSAAGRGNTRERSSPRLHRRSARLFGFDVRVQETDAGAPRWPDRARLQHHRDTCPGGAGGHRALSHYDSVPAAGRGRRRARRGGALEAARVLAARANRNWSLMVLLTDGEEAGLMGAAALVTDREVPSGSRRTSTSKSIGSAGAPLLFERVQATAGSSSRGRDTAASAGRVVRHRDLRAAAERHRLFDFEAAQDCPASTSRDIGDSYAYHTARDTPERLSAKTLREAAKTVVAVMTALDAMDVTQRSGSS